jgi:hypothetical protein
MVSATVPATVSATVSAIGAAERRASLGAERRVGGLLPIAVRAR